MEYAQLESRVAFLDNQYRREREEMAQLRQRLEKSEAEKEELGKRLAALENELLSVKSELPKIDMLDSRTERFKAEVLNTLENQKERQRQSLKDAERSRNIEMESQTKAINEVRRELSRTRNLDELITLARTETERQAASIISISKRLDDFIHSTEEHIHTISYLEEQRRSDVQKVNEIQGSSSELHSRITLQQSKIELLEKQIPQFGQFQTALEKVRESVRAEVEKSQYQQAKVERTLKTWDELSATLQNRVEGFAERLDRYAEHHQRNIKALESLQEFQERLQREQHEFTELQRLTTDRLRSQTESWQTTQEQSIRKHIIQTERKLDETTRHIERLRDSIDQAAVQLDPLQDQFTFLLRIIEEDALARAVAARDWQVRFEQLATEDH